MVCAVLLCASAAVVASVTAATLYRLHVPLPYRDEWYNIFHFRRLAEGDYTLDDLMSQSNEHRLLFPRLFFFVDEMAFALSGSFDQGVTLALQAVNAALLVGWVARLVDGWARRASLAGFVVTLLFTLRQEQNFTSGFQLQFVGVFTAAALAGSAYAAALDRLRDGRGGAPAFFALAALGCFVAAYTMANGVLAGFVLAAGAALRRAPWRVPAATAAVSTALAALFFHGYEPSRDSLPLSHALAHPLPYLRYVAAYLGNPLGSGIRADQALGTVGLALAAGAAWRVWTGQAREGASLKLLLVALFVLASAGATAYGRAAAFGTLQATESRYATPSLLFWCATLLFWSPVALARRGAAAALGAAMAVLAAAALSAEFAALPALAARASALRRVSDSLLAGLYDAETARVYENTPPDEVAPLVPFLRERGLAAFADPDAAALGRPSAALGPIAPARGCAGTAAARADPALGARGVKLAGTAPDATTGGAPRRVVVADASGTVVGFGSASLPSGPRRGWSAYASADAGDVLHAYVRLADGSLCALGDAAVAPAR